MKLTFYGGVGQVTGANYLIEGKSAKVLIDCGLKQGSSISEKQNWDPFPYNPGNIAAVFITHSHIDHIGLLPKLYKDGFRGKVFSTPACRDFSELLLYDSQHVLSLDADEKRKPMLYEKSHIVGLMKLWEGVDYYKPVKIDSLEAVFYNAGHILGSSFILIREDSRLRGNDTKVVFSGDLGNNPAPLIGDKDKMPEADYCLIESTYGDRVHEGVNERKEVIEDLIEDTVKSKGTLMIPAFAMERTQELLYEINDLSVHGRIPTVPVFIDSPLAIRLTDVYQKYIQDLKSKEFLFDFSGLKKTLTTEESKAINSVNPPKIIIAGSGMMHAGRILHHLKLYLPDPNSNLLIVGYQAEGSLGRRIFDGAKKVKIHGEIVPVNARIIAIGGYSAHADQPQLISWLKSQRQALKKVFVVQGEEGPASILAQKIKDELAVDAEIPKFGKTYQLVG